MHYPAVTAFSILGVAFFAVAFMVALAALAAGYANGRIYAAMQQSHNDGRETLPTTDMWSSGGGLANSNHLQSLASEGSRWVNRCVVEVRTWAVVLLVIAVLAALYCHLVGRYDMRVR